MEEKNTQTNLLKYLPLSSFLFFISFFFSVAKMVHVYSARYVLATLPRNLTLYNWSGFSA